MNTLRPAIVFLRDGSNTIRAIRRPKTPPCSIGLLGIALSLLLSMSEVRATSYYANAVTGNNIGGSGTQLAPWKTITYALNQITGTGHTLYVAAGTYNTALGETFPIFMKDGVSMVGAGIDLTVVNAGGTNIVIKCVSIVDATTRLAGFTIKGGTSSDVVNRGLCISAGSVLRVEQNKISENSGGGLYAVNSSPVIVNNTITSNTGGGTYGSGIYLNNASPLLQGNTITLNSYISVYVSGAGSSPRIVGNIISKTLSSGYAYGIKCDYLSHARIINNTISDNAGDGIAIETSAPPDSIINNILSYNVGYGIKESGLTSDPGKVWYNLFHANEAGVYSDEGTTDYYTSATMNSGVPECKNNLSGDPLFVDRVNGDYHLRSGSPGIDAGDPTFGYGAEPTPNGGRIEIGAYGNTAEATKSGSGGLPNLTDYYVNALTGNNISGSGTLSAPWKTITYALNQITGTGHTLYVAAGTYNTALGEIFPIFMKDGVSMVGAGIDLSVVDAGGTNIVIKCVSIVDATTKLTGFTIKGGTASDVINRGLCVSGGSVLRVEQNKISANSGGGVYVVSSSPVIVNNVITSNTGGGTYGSGIYLNNASPLLQGNTITLNSYISLYISGTGSSPRIVGNIITNTLSSGGYGIRCDYLSRARIINNTISDNASDGIAIEGSATPDSIVNNILTYNAGYGIKESGSTSDPGKVWYNLFYANGAGVYQDEGTTDYYTTATMNSAVPECKNNLSGDPLFVDKANGDYNLRSGSAAINAGDPGTPPDPDGTRADIGALCYMPTAPSPPALSSPSNGAIDQPTTLTLSWGAPSSATKYHLQVSTSSVFTTFVVNDATLTGISKTIGPLLNGTTYFWRVRAGNSTGWSSFSGSWNFITAGLGPPAPVLVFPINGSTNVMIPPTLRWNTSVGATSYRVQVATNPTFTSTFVDNGSVAGTVLGINDVSPFTTYYWRVNAWSSGVEGSWSTVYSFTTVPIFPPPVSSGWKFSRIFFPNRTNGCGVHGIAVDPAGKIWIIPWAATDGILVGGSYKLTRAIYVFYPNGSAASFSPIKILTIAAAADTLYGSSVGLSVDKSGNILYSTGTALYRINYQNGAGMNKVILPLLGQGLTAASGDALGNIFVGHVLPNNPIRIYDANFNPIGLVANSSTGYSRSLAVSSDGKDLYWPEYTNYKVYTFHSSSGATGPYTKIDSVLNGLSVESMAWNPKTGHLWVSSGSDYSPPLPPYTKQTWYAYNISSHQIEDTIGWNISPGTAAGRPRGIAFSNSGDTAYIGCYNVDSNSVQMFIRQTDARPSSPQNLLAVAGNSQVTLKWSKNTEADFLKYRIYIGTDSTTTSLKDSTTASISDTSKTITGLTNGTKYFFRVSVLDSARLESGKSIAVSATPALDQVQVAGGTFQMGSTAGNSDETPVHSVTLSAFYIDKTEITYEKWTEVRSWGLMHGYTDLVVGRNGYNGTANHPVTEVNWYDILKWCNARSEKEGVTPVYHTSNTLTTVYRTGQLDLAADAVQWTGSGYRLPTEAEWEFAARGGTKSKGYTYGGSNNIDSVAWSTGNAGNNTHAVATKGANELGIYDISGNVWEWCWDWHGTYGPSAKTDPKGPASGSWRVLRGGSFYNDANSCRVAIRNNDPPNDRNYGDVGFRCVQIDSTQPASVFPAVPQNLTATAGNSQVTLKWSKNTEIDFLRYRIYRSTTSPTITQVDSTAAGNRNDTTRTMTGLSNGTAYFFRVTAVDSAGNESAFSNEVIGIPRPGGTTSVIVVSSLANAGPGSLRQSILDAVNGTKITFDPGIFPPNNPATIFLTSALPAITQGNVVLDASNVGVIIDGSSAQNCHGFDITSNQNTIKGFQVQKFPLSGVQIENIAMKNTIGGNRKTGTGPNGEGNTIINNGGGICSYGENAGYNLIIGNYVGIDVTGTTAKPNGRGVNIRAPYNTIGSTIPGERNVVSGNTDHGIWIETRQGHHNKIIGNYIGTDSSGLKPVGNQIGVQLNPIDPIDGSPTHNTIGGKTAYERNIISGNRWHGIALGGDGVDSNSVYGNHIGCDVTGTVKLANGNDGINVSWGPKYNQIGGINSTYRNVISGNRQLGVTLGGAGTDGNLVIGNYIGVDATGISALGNNDQGIMISGAPSNNIVGGQSEGERNIISANTNGGLIIYNANKNKIVGNFIGTDMSGNRPLGNLANGITIDNSSSNNTIEKNVISGNTSNGLLFWKSKANTAAGNFVGTNATGSIAVANKRAGIAFGDSSTNNVIGGTFVNNRNIISGNVEEGIVFAGNGADSNSITGNYIGINAAGTDSLPNGRGIRLQLAKYNSIGGLLPSEANVISGNTGEGIFLWNGPTYGNVIRGNFIGVSPDGRSAIANKKNGITCGDVYNNVIGGNQSGCRNIISGNSGNGVELLGQLATSNVIIGNYIGTSISGLDSIPNLGHGIRIHGSANKNIIGGDKSGERNVVSGNRIEGISIWDADSNTVMGNFVGVGADGSSNAGNRSIGLSIGLADYNMIGGKNSTSRNIIMFNGNTGIEITNAAKYNVIDNNVINSNKSYGLYIHDSNTDNNSIIKNHIGTDTSETLNLGNMESGIRIAGGSKNNAIGGSTIASKNTIAFNKKYGVNVADAATSANSVSRNSIYSNTLTGIALSNGANTNILPPALSSMRGSLFAGTGIPGAIAEIYADSLDEGKMFLDTVRISSSGNFTKNINPLSIPTGYQITALQTSNSNTSAFAVCTSLKLISPNGGEQWIVGTRKTISWTNSYVANFKIEYTSNNGSSWIQIVAATPAVTGSYSWTVPNTPSTQCKIRISDASNSSAFYESDTTFSIALSQISAVTIPAGTQSGTTVITYSLSVAMNDSVRIVPLYSVNGGTSFDTIRSTAKPIPTSLVSKTDTIRWLSSKDYAGESYATIVKLVPLGRGGAGLESNSKAYTMDNRPPQFAGATSAAGDTNRILVGWNAAKDLSLPIKYRIYKSISSNAFNFGQSDTIVTDTTVVVKNLVNFTRYYFIVRAEDAMGNVDTNIVKAEAMPQMKATALIAASSSKLANNGNIRIPFEIKRDAKDTVKLKLLYSMNSGGRYDTARTLGGLTNGVIRADKDTLIWSSGVDCRNESVNAKIKIVPFGLAGVGMGDSSATFIIDNLPPRFGGIIDVQNKPLIKAGAVVVRWDAAKDTSKVWYYTYRSPSPISAAAPGIAVDSTGALSDTLFGQIPNKDYYYHVQSRDAYWNLDTNSVNVQRKSALLADYDSIAGITTTDLIQFKTAWESGNKSIADIAPASGNPPNLIPLPNDTISFDDYFTFARMWNWWVKNNTLFFFAKAQKINSTDSPERVIDIKQDCILIPDHPKVFTFTTSGSGTTRSAGISVSVDPKKISIDSVITAFPGEVLALHYLDRETGHFVLSAASLRCNLDSLFASGNAFGLVFHTKTKLNGEPVRILAELYDSAGILMKSGLTSIELNWRPKVPLEFALSQNYPNPFNPSTTIEYQLPQSVPVSITAYNVLGQEVKRLVNSEMQPAGYYTVTWDGRNNFAEQISSGMYLYRIIAKDYIQTRKMMLLK